MFLEIMTDPGNIGGDLVSVCETDSGDLPQRGVGLLGGGSIDPYTNSTALGTVGQGRGRGLFSWPRTTFSDQLVDGGHKPFPPKCIQALWTQCDSPVNTFLVKNNQSYYKGGIEEG